MRKISLLAAVFFIASTLFLSSSTRVFAQGESYSAAYNEYQASIEEYQNAHADYVLKRSQYLRFRTQTAQTAARDATATMLQARDEVVIRYLLALEARVNEGTGITQVRKELLIFKIAEEVLWFNEHKETVPSAGTLNDLVQDSDEAENHFVGNEGLHYEVLANIGLGKINDFIQRLDTATASVKEKVNEIRSDDREEFRFSDRKLQVLDRWIFEAETRIVRAKEKQQEAENMINNLGNVQRGAGLSRYNDIVETLGESQLFLREASSFLQEIIREIKTAEG